MTQTTPLEPLNHPIFEQHNIQVWMKRDDLNHPIIQGNKLHKLHYNLQEAIQQNCQQVISFGGAYSNHILALAAATQELGLASIGIIRGEELAQHPEKWSPTLQQAQTLGMKCQFVSRKTYRLKAEAHYLAELQTQYPNSYIVPEGGTNTLAIKGFQSTCEALEQQCPNWTHLYTAVGTGGTLAGLTEYSATKENRARHVIGIAVLNEADYLREQIQNLTQQTHWQLLTQYSVGGYAKKDDSLIATTKWFEETFSVLLDPIYTSKMVTGFLSEMKQGKIPAGSKVILYHSGGLQGRADSESTF